MKHYSISILLIITLIFTNFISLFSQSTKLTLEDIYSKNVYAQKGINALRWMDDNLSYSVLERGMENSGINIVKYDIKSGNKEILVSSSDLIPNGGNTPIAIQNYTYSSNNSKLLIYTNSQRVWRDNTRGDYWVLDLKTKSLTQVGQGFEPSQLMFAKFSPDGTKVAFVYKNNIYIENLTDSKISQLTFDGSNVIINGNFDWVYEEELHQQDGFRWSPDGKRIAFWQFDTSGTGVFNIINNIDSIYSKVIPFPYPKVGTPNSAAKVGVVEIGNGDIRWFDIEGDPRNNYIARMEFVPNSNELMIQQLNRLQNCNKVYMADASTMSLNNILVEKDEAFLDIYDNIVWLDGERFFTWTSEEDGWRHLYKVSRDGKSKFLITKGDFDVISIVKIDIKGGYVYYLASPESAVDQYLYKSRIDGKGKAERITPKDQVGKHDYKLTPNAEYALHTYSNSDTPTIYEIISLQNHKVVRVLEDNHELKAKYASLNLNKREYFRVDIGEVVLDGWMIKPSNFDQSKKYPVIFYIYGEPWSSTIQNSWSSRDLWNQFLAEQGYIVMSIDPRGTNNPRGRGWRKSIYGKVGIVAPADHAAAVIKAQEMFSFIDSSRIGIWGWSGGGSSTLHAMFKYPKIYKTGIAVAFVSSQYLYDTIYQERYMGLPSTNKEGYRDGSPINFASQLEGNLMLIHGTGDDNVHYQSCEMLVNELIKQNKMFSMLSYPMRSHSIYERENTTLHLYRSMYKYWMENLYAGGK